MDQTLPTASLSDLTTAVNVAILGFGSALLVFRIQRENDMRRAGETTWFPWADRLIISALFLSTIVGLLVPLVFPACIENALPRVAAAASCVLFLGFVPAILAHYRIVFGTKEKGSRRNPEPLERRFVWLAISVAILAAIAIVVRLN